MYLVGDLFINLFLRLFVSSAKKNMPSEDEKVQQKSTDNSRNSASVLQNSHRSNHAANNSEQDNSMFNDDDDDLDITEIDQAMLEGKAPLASQKTEGKVDKMTSHNDVRKAGAVSTGQRYKFCCVIKVK